MPLQIASLNSGSNGNCYYIGDDRDAVLVDAGISCRETERRMQRLDLPVSRVKAIFISHEHTDHTRGVAILSRKHRIPVYITPATHRAGRLWLDPQLVRPFSHDEAIQVGDLTVQAFRKDHDGIDPHSFTVTGRCGTTTGVFTDIGAVSRPLQEHLKRCHAAFLESNYDRKMLMEGPYPYHLKRRISGGNGHLSNNEALELFATHRSSAMKLLVLSHLSAQNNHPELVRELFMPHSGETRIEVASRHAESAVFNVHAGNGIVTDGRPQLKLF